ncbi:hypothetical protein Tco_1507623 [Tanacetum coccineum]
MLQICPKLLGQKFKDPPFEEEIISFIRDLRHTGEIKVLSDVNVNHMHQPWRSFPVIINKCLSGKTTALENLVYQVENKNSKKNNDIYYPRFTKVIVDYFMAKDQSILRRNKMFWHTARDDPMFTIIRVISKHQDTQIYGAILPQHLTNQSMLESEAYKTYHAYATGEKIPKPKYVKNKADPESSLKKKSVQASEGKRLKTSAKVTKPAKKKQPATTSKAKGLNVLSEVALSEAEQMKLGCLGADKGTGVKLGVPDVPTYDSKDEQISWKSSDEDDDDEVNESEDDDQNDDNADNEDDDDQNDDNADNEDDDDQNDDNADNEDDDDQNDDNADNKEEEWSDDEAYDKENQGVNVEGEELDEEEINEEEEANELYRDLNVNLEERDIEMMDALLANVQTTQVIEDTHVIITAVTPEVQQQSSFISSGFISNMLNPNPDTGIDSILNLNTELTSLVDVPISTNVEMPPSSVTPLPPPPFLSFNITLEDDFSEFKQTNQFAAAVSSIPSIVDTYLANKMNEAVKTNVQLQSDRLRDEAQDENEDFINTLDENMRKIIKKQVKEQVKEQVSKILPKIKKFINDQLKAERRRDGKELESTSAPKEKTSKLTDKSKEGSKSYHTSIGKSTQAEEPIHADEDLEEPAIRNSIQRDLRKINAVDRDRGETHHRESTLAQNEDPCDSFNEVMDTPLDFSAFVMNRLKVDTLILELLAGPTYELMKGSCKSLVELEYFLEEVYKATTDQLDWNNPEGQQYLHDLRKLLPLIPNS